jgi:hypothetical protein
MGRGLWFAASRHALRRRGRAAHAGNGAKNISQPMYGHRKGRTRNVREQPQECSVTRRYVRHWAPYQPDRAGQGGMPTVTARDSPSLGADEPSLEPAPVDVLRRLISFRAPLQSAASGHLDSMGRPSRASSLDSLGKPTHDYPLKSLDCLGIVVGLFRYTSNRRPQHYQYVGLVIPWTVSGQTIRC